MANTAETRGKLSGGLLIAALLTAVLGAAALVMVLVYRAKAADWNQAQTGWAVAAGLLLAAACWLWTKPVAAALEPAEAARPHWQTTLALGGAVLAVAMFLLVAAQKISGYEWGKVETILTILGVAGLIAAAVVWWEPLRGALGGRGTMLQLNAGVTLILTLGILYLLNAVIIERHLGAVQADWTKEKYYSLAEQTKSVVKSLDKEHAIEIIGIMPTSRDADPTDLEVMRRRLEDFSRLSPNLSVKVLDPYVDLEARKLIEEGALSSTLGAVVRFKERPSERESLTSVDEGDITRAIMKLLQPSSRKLYFTTGHGEPDLDSTEQNGLDVFKRVLENDRYTCAKLELFKVAAVPDDAAAVIAVSPRLVFQAEELQKLETYLSGGGRLLAFVDPADKSNLTELLAKYGLDYHGAEVTDPTNALNPEDARAFVSADFGEQEPVKLFRGKSYMAWFIGSGYFTRGTQAADMQLDELIKSSTSSYTQTKAEGETPGTRENGPFALVMTATTKDPEPTDDKNKDKDKQDEEKPQDKPRIRVAVVGDGEFVANMWQQAPTINFNVGGNLVAWLTDNTPAIGIRAKDPSKDLEGRKIQLDAKARKWLLILTVVLPLIVILAAAVAVQIARR